MKVNKRKTGPKNKITKRLSLIMKRYIRRENYIGNKVTSTKILKDISIDVSRRTAINWLNKTNYKY